jgi:hypothetical protein
MKHFMLIATDGRDLDDRVVPRHDILSARLKQCAWSIYAHTKNRNAFAKGARLLFYLGGHKYLSQHFVAAAVIASVRSPRRAEQLDSEDLLATEADRILDLCEVHFFDEAVSIYSRSPPHSSAASSGA